MGGHTLTNTYSTLLEIIGYYDKENQMLPKPGLKFEVFQNGRFSSILGSVGIFNLIFSLPNLMFQSKEGKSIATYYSKVIGKKNYHRLFRYLFSAILCQNADDFPAELLFKKRKKDKSHPKKYVLKKGIQQLFDIVRTNPNITVLENTEITNISKDGNGFNLMQGERVVERSANLVLACPSNVASFLLKSEFTKLSNLLKKIETAQVTSVLVEMLDNKAIQDRKKSILGLEGIFYSAMFINHGEKRYWCFYFNSEAVSQTAEKEYVAEVFGVENDEVHVIQRKQFQLPKLHVGNLETIAEIEAELNRENLIVAANYLEGLSIEDCCLRGKKEAYRMAGIKLV